MKSCWLITKPEYFVRSCIFRTHFWRIIVKHRDFFYSLTLNGLPSICSAFYTVNTSSLVAAIKLVNQGCTLLSMTSHPIPLYQSCQSVLHCSVVNCITMVSRLFISSKLCHQSHQRCRSVQLTNSLTSKGWRLKLLNDNSCHQIINARPIVNLVDWELKMIEP